MKNTAKIIGIVLGVFLFVILISGLTYAIYTWATIEEENKVMEGISDCFKVVYTKGNDIGSDGSIEKIQIGSTYTEGVKTTVKIKLDSSCKITSGVGTLYLNTTEISDVLKDNGLLSYQVLDGSTVIDAGTISDIGTITLYDDISLTTTEKSITVYLWVSGENITNDNLEEVLASIYRGNITARAESR